MNFWVLIAPIPVAILLGFVQLGIYKIAVRDPERIPMFPILMMRGFLVVLGLILVGAIVSAKNKRPGKPDAMLPQWVNDQVRERHLEERREADGDGADRFEGPAAESSDKQDEEPRDAWPEIDEH